MTDPDRPAHTTEPAEGSEDPGARPEGQSPHPEQPAEGEDVGGDGADTPGA